MIFTTYCVLISASKDHVCELKPSFAHYETEPCDLTQRREDHCPEVKEAWNRQTADDDVVLTVDADDFDHCDRKEWQGSHLHLHQHRCDEKHHKNDRQTA